MRTIEKRIKAIEDAVGKDCKVKIVWDDGCGNQGVDLADLCRARAAASKSVAVVGWLPDAYCNSAIAKGSSPGFDTTVFNRGEACTVSLLDVSTNMYGLRIASKARSGQ